MVGDGAEPLVLGRLQRTWSVVQPRAISARD